MRTMRLFNFLVGVMIVHQINSILSGDIVGILTAHESGLAIRMHNQVHCSVGPKLL